MSIPVFSIIIPTYNRAQLVCRSIKSVQNQIYKNWECIVVDDSSTDNTSGIVQQFSKQDPRIKYLQNQRSRGAQGARNTGIQNAQGQWILLLDSDNEIEPDYLYQIYVYSETHPDVDIITNYLRIILPDGTESHTEWETSGNILNDLLQGNTYVDNSSACIRKTILNNIGLLDEKCPSYQEWDTHIRIAQVGRYGCVKKHLTKYYEHQGLRVSSCTNTLWSHGLYVLRKHRKLWINKAGKDSYTRMLLQVYEERKSLTKIRQALVTIIVIWLSPKLGKQLVKRRFKC